MSNNPLPQTAFMPHEELEMLRAVQIQYGLTTDEIRVYADKYVDANSCDILDALTVMLEGSDVKHVGRMNGDTAWDFYCVSGKGYVWDVYEVGSKNDPNLVEDDSRPEDFPEHTLRY